MFCQHENVVQKRSSGSVIKRGKPSDSRFPRQMGSLGLKVLITGGSGYCGFYLTCALIREGIRVVLLDILKPTWEIPEGAVFLQGDVQDYEKVLKASEGIDTVFHLASIGMDGAQQKEEIESVNVGGTKVIIDVCKSGNISKLIYASTVNVIFGGIPIEDGDETLPYFPPEKQWDNYSRTKTIAEQMVLAASGASLQGGEKLRTCALRFSGIYGPGDQRTIPVFIKVIQRHPVHLISETPDTWMNWIHVDNATQAFLLASKALTAEKNFIASGQAYFVHDGEKVNFFKWIVVLYEKLDHQKPSLYLSPFVLKITAIVMEYLHWLLNPIFNFTPLLTQMQVKSVVVTNTFSIDKARNQLGYSPKPYSPAEVMGHYLQTEPTHKEEGCSFR
ncbi:putative short-chain dehydrogenase/reductase family 42E member 2 [Python bivittatus]|uniref:Short-chain dehydrogenase/reductase family 42E member 2 n=1 Tax=Python bivittatus TaxID=176946 RepID=A0A9F5ITA8_PYTBI|nr:putative short-chain dehydrogenase/reductase family 42E member 2 [Python bivittatus]